ncbi:TPA: glycosyltransferase, partial [Yersinia enterocolitica]|nr:glycosyltransferase [Yersinia enterocolitica]
EKIRESYIYHLDVDILLVTYSFRNANNNIVLSSKHIISDLRYSILLLDEPDEGSDSLALNEKKEYLLADITFSNSEFTCQDIISTKNNKGKGFLRLLTSEHLESARNIVSSLRQIVNENNELESIVPHLLRMAYISPLPPVKSGISDYSAELLPELAHYYNIDVVCEQIEEITDDWILSNCSILDSKQFRDSYDSYDRILYHFGNSRYHAYMVPLLIEIPGVVVLHDFYLPDLIIYINNCINATPANLFNELMYSHSWPAVIDYHKNNSDYKFLTKYPCNLKILQQASGIIYHSDVSKRLGSHYYGSDSIKDWNLIPLLRSRANNSECEQLAARDRLGIAENEFVVCSFGFISPQKLHHRLLTAWLASPMANDTLCKLVFVGENPDSNYKAIIERDIKCNPRISITGWITKDEYRSWLSAADVCVQLRGFSRGETSAAVLDCLNYGLPTIVNTIGSMADLPDDVVCKLTEEFTDKELTDALTKLYQDEKFRGELSNASIELLHSEHTPFKCAEKYMYFIEKYYKKSSMILPNLIKNISQPLTSFTDKQTQHVATILARNSPPHPRRKQLLIDVSALIVSDLGTGIQRVVRALLTQLISNPPDGYIVEAVYTSNNQVGYRYARSFTCKIFGLPQGVLSDDVVEMWNDDIFLGLDFHPFLVYAQKDVLKGWYNRGVKVFFVVYDLLPILKPSFFPEDEIPHYLKWLDVVTEFTGAICISETVSKELALWIQDYRIEKKKGFSIRWFHLGADLNNSSSSKGMSVTSKYTLEKLSLRQSFLIVSTLEPRKGHAQVLAAFELLWLQGIDVNLVIVGKKGWMVESLVKKIRSHPELNQRLFWLEGISDEFLEKVYEKCNCLISASQGEGFGLPLIEASQHQLPIIARDIPVFREVTAEHALYFSGNSPEDLSSIIQKWIELYENDMLPNSKLVKWQTWEQSARQLLDVLLGQTTNT